MSKGFIPVGLAATAVAGRLSPVAAVGLAVEEDAAAFAPVVDGRGIPEAAGFASIPRGVLLPVALGEMAGTPPPAAWLLSPT